MLQGCQWSSRMPLLFDNDKNEFYFGVTGGMPSFDLVKACMILFMECGTNKQLCIQDVGNATDNLPVGWTEVRIEG